MWPYIERGEPPSVQQGKLSLCISFDELQDSFISEHRKRARDGLQGQSEIIGDVSSVHWQDYYIRMSEAFVHFQQERDYPLQCGFSPQQEHAVLGVLKVSSDEAYQVHRTRPPMCRCVEETASPHYANLRLNNRFGRKAMRCSILKTEHVSWKVERIDLTPTIWKQLVGAYCTIVDLVHELCFLSLAENLPSTSIIELTTKDGVANESSQVSFNRTAYRIGSH
jgi:hypothetical protein